jgi:hypothetical protein
MGVCDIREHSPKKPKNLKGNCPKRYSGGHLEILAFPTQRIKVTIIGKWCFKAVRGK